MVFLELGQGEPEACPVGLVFRKGGEIQALPHLQGLLPAARLVQGSCADQQSAGFQIGWRDFREIGEGLGGAVIGEESFSKQQLCLRVGGALVFLEPTADANGGIAGQAIADHLLGDTEILGKLRGRQPREGGREQDEEKKKDSHRLWSRSILPVALWLQRATSAGVPRVTMRPPASPPPGPRSTR